MNEQLQSSFKEDVRYKQMMAAKSTPPIYLSIDPGKKGGIAVMKDDKIISMHEMPLINDDIDVLLLGSIIRRYQNTNSVTVILEDVHSIYGTSSGSNFTFGFVCGQIDAVVKLCEVRVIPITPKVWQKQIWVNSDIVYKSKKAEQKKASIDTKATSLNAVKRLFPNEDIRGEITTTYYGDTPQNRKLNRVGAEIPCKKASAHDGIVDAMLMCEAARRLNY